MKLPMDLTADMAVRGRPLRRLSCTGCILAKSTTRMGTLKAGGIAFTLWFNCTTEGTLPE